MNPIRHMILLLVCLLSLPLFAAQATPFSSSEDTATALQPYLAPDFWQQKLKTPPLTRQALLQSLEAARAFYLNQQKTIGNFTYMLDLSTGKTTDDDNQVRQAGALWGLACLNRDFFNEPTRQGIFRGIEFFASHLKLLPSGKTCITYPRERNINTGTVALFCLALTDFLDGQEKYLDQPTQDRYRRLLFTHIQFLQSMELEDGSWSRAYDTSSGIRIPVSSPYYDGEALLAYCKVARKFGRNDLLQRINLALPRLIHKYTIQSWQPDGDPDDAKGFFQWGCMSFAEYIDAGWGPHQKLASDAALALAWWQIDDNQLEAKKANVAYAVEGLVAAYRIAGKTGNTSAATRLRGTLEHIMARLITCQYQGPFMASNPYLSSLTKVPENGYGGITAAINSPFVRIDNVQHQVHATLLMLKYLFPEQP